jgi:hypothetical protein
MRGQLHAHWAYQLSSSGRNDVLDRVVFHYTFGPYIGTFDASANSKCFRTTDFKTPFQYWRKDMAKRRDVFLGYCSSSSATADRLKMFLTTVGKETVRRFMEEL